MKDSAFFSLATFQGKININLPVWIKLGLLVTGVYSNLKAFAIPREKSCQQETIEVNNAALALAIRIILALAFTTLKQLLFMHIAHCVWLGKSRPQVGVELPIGRDPDALTMSYLMTQMLEVCTQWFRKPFWQNARENMRVLLFIFYSALQVKFWLTSNCNIRENRVNSQ